MPPTICDLPPVEHHYTLDKYGRPIEVQSVIFIPPNNQQQIHKNSEIDEMEDYQLDLFYDLLKAIDEKDIRRIVDIIDTLPKSFRKQTKKLFAEVGKIKKQQQKIEYKNKILQEEIDYLYHSLNIQKRGFNDICNLCQ